MLLPIDRLDIASIANVDVAHLLIAVDRDGALIWVVAVGDDKYAVFLTGEFSGRGFRITPDSGGRGVSVAEPEIRIDPTSVSANFGDWALKAAEGTLAVSFVAQLGGFDERVWGRVADLRSQFDNRLYFSRWSLGVPVDQNWVKLISFNDGRLEGPLINASELR